MVGRRDIKEMRLQMGLTQNELAASLGVTRTTISNWETGVSSPTGLEAKILEQMLSACEEGRGFSVGRKVRKALDDNNQSGQEKRRKKKKGINKNDAKNLLAIFGGVALTYIVLKALLDDDD